MVVRAVWNGQVIAESENTVMVEGNHYFPRDAVRWEHFTDSDTHTTCSWKGVASYYAVTVDGQVNPDAAWFYPDPLDEAEHVRDRVAFWRGVEVTES